VRRVHRPRRMKISKFVTLPSGLERSDIIVRQRARLARRAASFRCRKKCVLAMTLKRFLERSDIKLRPLSPPLPALKNLKLALLSSGVEHSDKNGRQPRLFFRSRHQAPEISGARFTNQNLLRCSNHRHGRCLRDDRSAHVFRIQPDHLSRLRRLKSHLPCQRIDSARITQ
jgi:hypothetical protein